MTPAAIMQDLRRRLQWRHNAGHLLWRMSSIIGDHVMTFKVSARTANLWLKGDPATEATLTKQIDTIAERYKRAAQITAPDGMVLYRRMIAP